MIAVRISFVVVFLLTLVAIGIQWHWAVGFNSLDPRWWVWLLKTIMVTGGLPSNLLYPVWWTGAAGVVVMGAAAMLIARADTTTLHGGRDARNTHGSARWANMGDARRAALLGSVGAVVGGWKGNLRVRPLHHNGPEHILAYAPTRSGKGVGLVVPTLLSWLESALVLDIKGENYALTAGWRNAIGHRVLRFDPAALCGSARYNPLAEVRIGSPYQVADAQNIASMIVDPEGKGLKDFWMKEGWGWLTAAILHVLYVVHRDSGGEKIATLADVHEFMSVGGDEIEVAGSDGDASFKALLDDMTQYEHGDAVADRVVRAAASGMKKRAPNERSGVHSSAKVDLSLYADPIVARNTSICDFRIADLMNSDKPVSLYLVIPPKDIKRLRPLYRLMLNQILNRLMPELTFSAGQPTKHYRYRLLLMLDEFTSLGKLDIFQEALAYMAGYGLKAFIIVQDIAQLQSQDAYGKDEAITSNCHIRVAYAPNKYDTAKALSELTGKTTLVQRKRSRSSKAGELTGNISESISEVGRNLMTPDECMSLPGLRKGRFGRVVPGDMLIFVAGQPAIYGRQFLFFKNRTLRQRSSIPAPSNATNEGENACQVAA
ncbi:MAG: type IV secretory system conjugative DNA transfer family protein [Alphaproteobacteria bacterium]|nr:type IV secretory system conjugative DNA transfer family protein [Alphaproteobacteria bacterium]